jgi:DNA-binding NarL/FixJ family response regulator
MAERFVAGKRPPANSPSERLSPREFQVFQLLGRGYSTSQIAEELHIAFKTAQTFRARIKVKLKLPNATELLREAMRCHDSQ